MGDGTYVQAIVVARTSDWPPVARALQSSPILETLAASKKVPDWHPIRCIPKTAGVAAAAVGRGPAIAIRSKVAAANGHLSHTGSARDDQHVFKRDDCGATYIGQIYIYVSRGQ